MATRFTRLSIVAGDRQLDASLPSSRPVAELIPELPLMFGLPHTTPPTVWALSTSRSGTLAGERTLADAGVLDGDVVYLSSAGAAAESPVVDDVLTALSTAVDDHARPWAGAARDWVITCLLAAIAVTLTAALAAVPNPRLSGALLLAAFAASTGGAVALRGRGGLVLGWAGLPAVPAGLFRLTDGSDLDVRLVAAVSAGLAGVAAVAYAARHARAVVVAGLLGGVLAAGAAGVLAAGADGSSIAAWASLGIVLALGVLPQLALVTSGLLGLVRQAEAGNPARREAVSRSLASGRATIDGAVAALGLVGSAAVGSLIWAGRPAQAWLGALVALIFLLRSRSVSQAPLVAFLLAVPVTALIATAASLPHWAHVHSSATRAAYWSLGTLAIAFLVALAGYTRLPEVTSARLSRLWDRVDLLAVLALVPIVLLAQNVLGWLADKL